MSRVSLSRRMAAIETAIMRRDPFGFAVHNLSPELREAYDEWVARCDRITVRHDNPYTAMLDGQCHFPRMPYAVATVIDSRLCSRPLSADCSENDARDAYNALLSEDAR